MKERPILFSAPMVLAILAGKKTQTRRVIRVGEFQTLAFENGHIVRGDLYGLHPVKPYAQVGDRLWVKETWFHRGRWIRDMDDKWKWDGWEPKNENARIDDIRILTADGDPKSGLIEPHPTPENWGKHVWRKRPSIYMPRWASRITLEVTDVRVERLQSITASDAVAEGVIDPSHEWDGNPHYPLRRFHDLWESINGKRAPWSANPWVWVVEFRRVRP